MKRCLYCYQPLTDDSVEFHTKCSRKMFGMSKPPILSFGKPELKAIAKQIIGRHITVTGVQPKLSLELEKIDTRNSRLTIVGLWGSFILKPPSDIFSSLPENESLTMKLANLCEIKTAEHSLIRLQRGELAYITKRFDREKGYKIHVEDFCQLTETLTEHKYRSSMEKVGKTIRKFSTNSGLDVLSFFELTIFCFLTGNADMHLKNFSLLRPQNGEILLSPAYDLVSTKLAMPDDLEQIALTLNGKKNRLKKTDFIQLATSLNITPKVIDGIFNRFEKKIDTMINLIEESFLEVSLREQYKDILLSRISVLK